jgi:hypothetical protein
LCCSRGRRHQNLQLLSQVSLLLRHHCQLNWVTVNMLLLLLHLLSGKDCCCRCCCRCCESAAVTCATGVDVTLDEWREQMLMPYAYSVLLKYHSPMRSLLLMHLFSQKSASPKRSQCQCQDVESKARRLHIALQHGRLHGARQQRAGVHAPGSHYELIQFSMNAEALVWSSHSAKRCRPVL